MSRIGYETSSLLVDGLSILSPKIVVVGIMKNVFIFDDTSEDDYFPIENLKSFGVPL